MFAYGQRNLWRDIARNKFFKNALTTFLDGVGQKACSDFTHQHNMKSKLLTRYAWTES